MLKETKEINREKRNSRVKKWRDANPGKKKEHDQKWRANNPDKKRDYDRKWNAANTAKKRAHYKKNAEKYREQNLKRKYGLSSAAYDAMLAAQNGVCAICLGPESLDRKLAVDHCHTTGSLRALLCSMCNRGLGYFKDNTDIMLAAVAYVEQHTEKG